MTTINLRNFYNWYSTDVFVEVSDEVAEELMADKRYEKTHKRRMKRNKSISLDVESDLDNVSFSSNYENPETYVLQMEQRCRLCRALNSLPESVGKRIDAHYLQGISQKEIADSEGVTKGAVSLSITRGLGEMKKYLENFEKQLNFCP